MEGKTKTQKDLFEDALCKIDELKKNATFTVETLFTKEEWKKISIDNKQFLHSELQYKIRLSKYNDGYEDFEISEISDGVYKKTKPKKKYKVWLFDSDTPIQALFLYAMDIIENELDSRDKFQIKDIFPELVWNRFKASQKISLGLLFERFNNTGQNIFARIGESKQKQTIYTSLWNWEYQTKNDWNDVNVSKKGKRKYEDNIPELIERTRKLKIR